MQSKMNKHPLKIAISISALSYIYESPRWYLTITVARSISDHEKSANAQAKSYIFKNVLTLEPKTSKNEKGALDPIFLF